VIISSSCSKAICPENVSPPNGHLSRQHPIPVLGNPYQVNFQIRLSMCSKLVKSDNATTITFSYEGEGFQPSPKGTVISLLMDRALEGRMLRREEKVVLYYSIGLLDETGSAIHTLLESTPDYNYTKTKRQWERLQKNPISCLKIRSMLPDITSAVNCQCTFDLGGGKYPSPLMHVMPHMVPAAREFEIPPRLKLRQAAQRCIQLRRRLDEEKRALMRLEALLAEHFSAKGISEFKINDTKILRESANGQTEWRLEYS